MNLDQLEAINAVVEKGSFRAAADHLNRSQPALSTSIKNLEEEFGIQIFDRSEYRPKLTEAGSAFIGVAKATLNAAHYAARIAVELGKKETETKLRVSVDPLISNGVIELLAYECARPVVPLNLIIDKSILRGSYQTLLNGEVDLAFAPCPQDEEKIEKIILEKVVLVGAISRKLLQEKRSADQAFLNSHPQILVYDKTADEPPDVLMPNAVQGGIGHKIFVPDHFTKLRLIEAGIGWGRIARTEFDKTQFDNGEQLRLIDENLCAHVTLELCALRAKHRPLGPVARAVWKAFEQKIQL